MWGNKFLQVQSSSSRPCVPPQEVQLKLTEQCSLEAWADKLQAWGWKWSPACGSCVRLTHHAEVLGTALGATDFQVKLLFQFSRHDLEAEQHCMVHCALCYWTAEKLVCAGLPAPIGRDPRLTDHAAWCHQDSQF